MISKKKAIKYPEHESSTVEFKVALPKNEQIIKTIIGFCNQKGGKLIVGIDDDRTIIGLAEETIQQAMEYLEKSIYEASNPPIHSPCLCSNYLWKNGAYH